MASSFTIRYSGSIIPYEIVTLADTTTTIKSLHSVIDTGVGGSIEKTIGDTSTFIKYMAYETTTSGVALSAATLFNVANSINFLCVKIVSAASSATPQVEISLDGTNYEVVLLGAGDICMIPTNVLSMNDVKIKTTGATAIANIVIMVAEEQ